MKEMQLLKRAILKEAATGKLSLDGVQNLIIVYLITSDLNFGKLNSAYLPTQNLEEPLIYSIDIINHSR